VTIEKFEENVLEQDVNAIVAEVFEIPVGQINKQTTMENVDTWDSLRHMEMIVAIERRFNVEFEAEEALEMTSVEAINRMLDAKLK
jgi:acyl carrier protein